MAGSIFYCDTTIITIMDDILDVFPIVPLPKKSNYPSWSSFREWKLLLDLFSLLLSDVILIVAQLIWFNDIFLVDGEVTNLISTI